MPRPIREWPAGGLTIGSVHVNTPVVLAPMAGVTNTAFRMLCREFGDGLFVCEMITSRALVERNPEAMRLIGAGPGERPHSVQLYGIDPPTVAAALTMIREEGLADHVDLNFGCPAPKVTRRGGGSALPWKLDLFTAIVRAAVSHAGEIPVTVKLRMGIDAEHSTFREAARIAVQEGAAAITLHGRTMSEHYSGNAHWDAIAELVQLVPEVPVLGNGDIWSAEDALEMVRRTGCAGVEVGRGCLGRPWLFADLTAAFAAQRAHPGLGAPDFPRHRPGLAEVGRILVRHTELLAEFFDSEEHACRDIRKHIAWYFKGYPIGGESRRRLARVETLEELRDLVGDLDPDAGYPGAAAEGARGRAGTPKRPHLPEGWLDSRLVGLADRDALAGAELGISGG
ncbi:MAG: tRNA dihydrouridine synthase DusB [Microbacteriaceae bacterium]|jgi:nifR3 family TIM-barrel protein|nr:tRNA dihydrouridine synthase DusB [Microbacteriaceae bacterium]MCI1206807.1 tRNA dihydrouridine synthase DusB [Microbacteriaceae bacterium]